jgi:hypothetical protein
MGINLAKQAHNVSEGRREPRLLEKRNEDRSEHGLVSEFIQKYFHAARSFYYKNSLTLFHLHFCASTKITDLRAPLPTRLGLLLDKSLKNLFNTITSIFTMPITN